MSNLRELTICLCIDEGILNDCVDSPAMRRTVRGLLATEAVTKIDKALDSELKLISLDVS